MNNAIILLSGGMDSSTLAYHIMSKKPKKALALFFNYSQRSLNEELSYTKKLCKELNLPLKIINLPWLGEISTSLLNKEGNLPRTTLKDLEDVKKEKECIVKYWVPCRNSIFVIAALAHAESLYLSKKEKYDIYIGIRQEGSISMKDTTPKFLKTINQLAKEATHIGNYKILAPFMDYDRTDVIELANRLHLKLENTYSCYQGGSKHCGTCSNCMQRKAAFKFTEFRDPTLYQEN